MHVFCDCVFCPLPNHVAAKMVAYAYFPCHIHTFTVILTPRVYLNIKSESNYKHVRQFSG